MDSYRRVMFVMITFTIIIVYVMSTLYLSRYGLLFPSRNGDAAKTVPRIKSSEVKNASQILKCPSVLSHMTVGHWKTRPLSKNEEEDISLFLFGTKPFEPLSSNFTRKDGLCGTVRADTSAHVSLCDPHGDKPCCGKDHCVNRPGCMCKDCYDLRQMKHGEYSSWEPSHPLCHYHQHSPREACDILDGMKLVFLGDSYVRQIYMAMLLVLSGDFQHGAMIPTADETRKSECRGMYVFKKICRKFLPKSKTFCNGRVTLLAYFYPRPSYGEKLRNIAMNLSDKSYIFTGIGVHVHYNVRSIQKTFLEPTMTYLKDKAAMWPKLVWMATHANGHFIRKLFFLHKDPRVKSFNMAMEKYLRPQGIPVFNTYNLTDGMMSHDMSHFGMGVNLVKSNILISYLNEQ